MSAVLTHHAYGKSQIRLTKVTRHAGGHDLKELCVAVQLEGDFAASYLHGDNRRIVATDTMKNTVYALAHQHALTDLESFGQALAGHFLEHYPHVSAAAISLVEYPWQRLRIDSQDHPTVFVGGSEQRTCTVTQTRQGLRLEAGLDELALLKTTDSAFTGFLRDAYTTLPETTDRICATVLSASWLYGAGPADWNRCHQLIRQALVETFARHKSLAVQQTLHAMGAAALEACRPIEEISLRMPNKHRLLVNLQPFGQENNNEIFMAAEEPYGVITGTLRRGWQPLQAANARAVNGALYNGNSPLRQHPVEVFADLLDDGAIDAKGFKTGVCRRSCFSTAKATSMSTVHAASEQRFILHAVPWRTYERALRAFADRPAVRLTFDRGILELMTLSHEHESYSYLVSRLIDALTEELGLPVKGGRSTTYRRRKRRRGLEPDASWWIAHEAQVRGKTQIDLRRDPPPDLALEVDVSHSSLDRLSIYAALGVPEVWRLEGQTLVCHLLGSDGRYTVSPLSRAFPGLAVADVANFLGLLGQMDENTLIRQLRAWVRQGLAAGGSNPPSP